ncbi:MAG: hypothetical protein U9R15_01395 [Chloroflexota bacterium]|nr:hypothetical protein [Chloroflexota bacterium]
MNKTPVNERVSASITETREMLLGKLVAASKKHEEWRDRTKKILDEQLGAYEQYLLTLDPDMLCNIMDISENDGNVFVTQPVEIGGIHDIAFTVHHDNLLCFGSRDSSDAQTIFAVPDGKYRFVLIAVPVEDDL